MDDVLQWNSKNRESEVNKIFPLTLRVDDTSVRATSKLENEFDGGKTKTRKNDEVVRNVRRTRNGKDKKNTLRRR